MPEIQHTNTAPSMADDLREAAKVLQTCALVQKMAGHIAEYKARTALAHRLEQYAAQAADR